MLTFFFFFFAFRFSFPCKLSYGTVKQNYIFIQDNELKSSVLEDLTLSYKMIFGHFRSFHFLSLFNSTVYPRSSIHV